MYKLYILELSGQHSPSPPTFFTLHLDRDRLRRVQTWMDGCEYMACTQQDVMRPRQ